MEKNLAENSCSFARKGEQANAGGDTSHSPVPDRREGDAEPTDKTEREAHKEDNEDNKADEKSNGKANEKSDEVPGSPLHRLDKISEDIDHLLATLQRNVEANAEEGSSEIPGFVDKFLDLVEKKIARYDSAEGKAKWGEDPKEDSSMLEAVDRVSKLVELLRQLKPASEEESKQKKSSLANLAGEIQQRAMAYLEEEFRTTMEEFRKPSESDPGGKDPKGKHEKQDSGQLPESEATESETGYPEDAISCLNKIAKHMVFGGYQFECCQVYMIVRRQAFEENLHKLEWEKTSIDDIEKMNWESLEREIPSWNRTFRHCASVYLPGERKLSESVFTGHPAISESLFSSLTHGVIIQLLNFAEGVAMTKLGAEKLFKFLDMYETLRDVSPVLNNLFSEEISKEMKSEMTSAKSRLGEAAISIFCELENSIRSDAGKPVPGGAIHPLTRWVVNYLKLSCEYKDALELVFKEHSKIERADSTSRPRHQGESSTHSKNDGDKSEQSPFSAQLTRMMDVLDANLETKARLYRDVALSSIFMMNNGRYILQKIKATEIHQSMGDAWSRKKSSDLRTFHNNYKRETWGKLLQCLNPEGLTNNGKVMKPVLKEKFKNFNAMFEEIHKTQSHWMVVDEQLQSELRVSISGVVIPAYRSFLGRYSQYLDPGRQTEKYIKLQPDDIETYIDDLFDGKNPTSMSRKRT
ncbi:hypothetical protein L6164_009083 [Bauhinia variegata]|uniref:Uncharacterized protein n=1 Tax=Bauhinia variegata TaxID=167791 RepID=A0ACB9PIN5_BAUVA|nr:hypothetical protein L6164_009083 [Bauhinia variegata]